MQVREVMTKNPISIDTEENIVNAAKLMRDANVGCLLVVNGGAVQGIITDRDLAIGCTAQGHNALECRVHQHMSSPLITGQPNWDAVEAAHVMNQKKVKRLPIVEEGQLVGLLSLSDVAQAFEQPIRDLLLGMGAVRRLQVPRAMAA